MMKFSKTHSKSIQHPTIIKQNNSIHVQPSPNITFNIKPQQQPLSNHINYSKQFVQDLMRKVFTLESKQKQIQTKFLFYTERLQQEINLKQQVNQSLRSEIISLKKTLLSIQSHLQSFVKENQLKVIEQFRTRKSPIKKWSPTKKSPSYSHKQNKNPSYQIKFSHNNKSKNLNLQSLITPRNQISLTQRTNINELSQYQLQQQMLQSRVRENRNDDYQMTKTVTQPSQDNNNFYYLTPQKPQQLIKSPTFKNTKSKLFSAMVKSKLFVK